MASSRSLALSLRLEASATISNALLRLSLDNFGLILLSADLAVVLGFEQSTLAVHATSSISTLSLIHI